MKIIKPRNLDWTPKKPWPEECPLMLLSGWWLTAYPVGGDTGSIICGGCCETPDAAEEASFAQFQREGTCQHRWGRCGYRNGYAVCHNCGASKMVFHEIVELGYWRKPLSPDDASYLEATYRDPEILDPGELKFRRQLELRKRVFGVEAEA
jgi:hypothetical protein